MQINIKVLLIEIEKNNKKIREIDSFYLVWPFNNCYILWIFLMFLFLLLNYIFFYFFVSVLESGQLFIPSLHKNGSLERYPLMSTIWTHCSINSVKTKSSGKSHHQKLHHRHLHDLFHVIHYYQYLLPPLPHAHYKWAVT